MSLAHGSWRTRLLVAVLASTVLPACAIPMLAEPSRAGAYLYWLGPSGISRFDLNGHARIANFAPIRLPRDSGLATSGGFLYFGPDEAVIGRVALGSRAVLPNYLRILELGQTVPSFSDETAPRAALAVAGDSIYWASAHLAIGRANVNGSEVNTRFIATPGSGNVSALAVAGRGLYWSIASNIGRANLDGSGVESKVATVQNGAITGLAVSGNFIYWTTEFGHSIGRVRLNGRDEEPQFIAESGRAFSPIVIGRYIYWRSFGFSNGHARAWIRRANIDGSGMTSLLDAAQEPGESLTGDSLGPPAQPLPTRPKHRKR
jgi:hypothetical protein